MRFWNDQKKYLRYMKYATSADLRAEVAGSYLNWLWWIFNPLCMMVVYTLIFGVVFDASEPYFPLFVFFGLTIWNYFNSTIVASVRMVKSNKSIVTKVYLPKFILIETDIMVNFVKMLFSFAIIVIMMIVMRVPLSVNIFWLIPILIIETMLTFGLSCLLLHFGVYVEDLKNIIKILMRLVFYGTGIFFSIPDRIHNEVALQILLHWNPMGFLMYSGRQCLLYSNGPEFLWLLFWFVVSAFLCWLGVRTIYKFENSYAKAI